MTTSNKLALARLAAGAIAVGALAAGAVAVGALAIGRLAIRRGRIEKLTIAELTIDRLLVRTQDGGARRVAGNIDCKEDASAPARQSQTFEALTQDRSRD